MIKNIITSFIMLNLLIGSTIVSFARNQQQENLSINEDTPGVQWVKLFGRIDNLDDAQKVRQTSDGGYILIGKTESYSPDGDFDIWLIKTDKDGSEEWNRTYGDVGWLNWTWGYAVEQTNDGGYVFVGLRGIYGEETHAWVVKTTVDGTEQWNKTYNASDRGFSIQQTMDGGYIITGNSLMMDAWVCRTDENGVILWEQSFYEADSSIGTCVQQTSDGGFIIVGRLYYPQNETGFLMKTDADGHEQWNKTYEWLTPFSGFYSVRQLSDGYIVTGLVCFGGSHDQAWLVRTDEEGDMVWNRTFSIYPDSSNGALEVDYTSDGGFIVTGMAQTTISSGWVLKTDAEGNLEWQIAPVESYDQIFYSVQETSDESFIVAGVSCQDDLSGDAVLLKIGHAPQVTITKPIDALYLFDKERCALRFPFIIGPITIEADAFDSEYSIERIDFIIDGILKSTDYSAPYSWKWTKPSLFFHTIQVIAINEMENSSSATITVFKFL